MMGWMYGRLQGIALGTALLGGCAMGDDEAEPFQWRDGTLDPGGTIIDPPDDPEPSGNDDGGGGRTGGDWIINGLAEPSVSGVNPAHALDSPQGLGAEGWLAEGDPEGEKVIRYLVECALDDGDSITVVPVGDEALLFGGHLGLAPQWKTGPCDETCQRWVSACLLARTNETGAEITLFVQGDHPSLGFGIEPTFPHYEGTFFGNVFADPAAMHACRGTPAGQQAAGQQGRTCTQSENECGFTTYANCVLEAGCTVGPTGVATIDCEPVLGGAVYPGISVHVASSP